MELQVGLRLPSLFLFLSWFLLTLPGSSASVEKSTYIVHMDKSHMPKAFTSHHSWYLSIIDSLNSERPTSTEELKSASSFLYTYNHVLHGFSVALCQEDVESLKNTPGFISAYQDRNATLDTTHTPEFLSLSPSWGLWPTSNYGEDVIIGVIDSGVWPESESFNDDGMNASVPARWKGICQVGEQFNSSHCNSKLIGARYFNNGILAANPNITFGMNSARDTIGHGTHTASTAAGNYVNDVSFFGYGKGTARGIAPRARLAVYKVNWREGRYASDVLAGIDQAIADGVDVISISMGFDGAPLHEDPIAIASFAAMEKGVLVSTSAGNEGPFFGNLHNGIPWVLTVAGGTVDRSFAGTLTLGNDQIITGWTLFPASAVIQNLPLVYDKNISACNSPELLSEAIYTIIICEQARSIRDQIDSLARSNVVGAILISNNTNSSELGEVTCPCLVISPKDAEAVIKYANFNEIAFASMKFQKTFLGAKPAPAVASYTSRGPSPSYPGVLKPDVMAPGSQILAAWVPTDATAQIGTNVYLSSHYNMVSGTSMACPHASGIAALLKAAHPEWSPAAIRSAMITTANPLDNTQKPIRDNGLDHQVASPLAMGAGNIDPNCALEPGLVYDATPQDYINLLCSMNFDRTQILAIIRTRSYNCSNPSSDLNYPSFIAFHNGKNDTVVKKFRRTVTNVGDAVAIYNASIAAPRGSRVVVYPQTLVFKEKYEQKSFTLTMKFKRGPKMDTSFGALVWTHENGKHIVRSPIVVSPMGNV
uniref:Subtilase n=1 Tax=Casuarina glauca TaxID=3522 RepID=Q84TR6_CASGL|nr:subtilase [Casuarina glauca]